MEKILEILNPVIEVFIDKYNDIWSLLKSYLSPSVNNIADKLSDKFWFILPRLIILFVVIWFLCLPILRLVIGFIKNFFRYLIESIKREPLPIRTTRIDEDGTRHYFVSRLEISKLNQFKSWNQGTVIRSSKKGAYGKVNKSRIQSIHTSRECRDWLYNLKHFLKHWDKIEFIVEVENYLD
ncbi:hypothetical protein ACVRZR_06295 [Streptococcus entericus]|uniref:hypothetical protein n=1 Tax=Streptococcus entericus TaxID=155680 RepID=UPI00036198BE|nr:hypothetical protein [Streptococcus entericus]